MVSVCSSSCITKSEKEQQTEQRKNRSWADCTLTDRQRSIQREDSEWTIMICNQAS